MRERFLGGRENDRRYGGNFEVRGRHVSQNKRWFRCNGGRRHDGVEVRLNGDRKEGGGEFLVAGKPLNL